MSTPDEWIAGDGVIDGEEYLVHTTAPACVVRIDFDNLSAGPDWNPSTGIYTNTNGEVFRVVKWFSEPITEPEALRGLLEQANAASAVYMIDALEAEPV